MVSAGLTTKYHIQFIGIVLTAIHYIAVAIEFPNTIVGTPRVDCQVDSVKLAVETSSGNPSHMFVKGRHHEPPCVIRNHNMILIKHESCGLGRERSLNPAGVYYKVCVVVQLHPQFITKVDRTFCASCFYMEAVKELTNEIGVSVMSSTEVAVSFPMPVCTYTIRRGSQTGTEIRFATVGEPVYHVWSCPSDSYGALVQNCFVDDGQGNKILIIDQNGCGVDRYIIQTPTYNDQLNVAYQESHVFKFADRMITRFTCQVKICVKAGNGCQGITPPQNCPLPSIGVHVVAPATPPTPANRVPYLTSLDGSNLSRFPDSSVGGQTNTLTSTATTTTESPVRPPYKETKTKFRNRFRSIRELNEDNDNLRAENVNVSSNFNYMYKDSDLETDYIDVAGELLVLEDVGQTSDKKLYEDILNAMSNGSFKRQMRPENSICVPSTGFVTMLILFTFVTVAGLSAMACILVKNRRNIKKNALK